MADIPAVNVEPDTTGTPAPSGDRSHRALAGAVRSVSGMTLLSRFGGLAREVLVVRIFGSTPLGSAFVAAFAIPNLFRRLFGEGALSAAFIPEYARTHKDDPAAADAFASLTVAALFALTAAITAVAELGLLLAILLLPHDADRVLSLRLVMVMLPFMPLVCTAAILGGMLQVHGKFAASSAGPVILNAIVVGTGLYFLATGKHGDPLVAYALGIATVLSGITQCLWFLRLLRPHVRWSRAFAGAGERVRAMLRRFVPVLIGMGTLQINTFLDTLYAMWPIWVGPTLLGFAYPMDASSNIILASAQRLYHFPLGVFGIAVATAVFPMLSRHADQPGEFVATLRRGLRLSMFIGLPASIGLILVRHDITAVLYGFGHSGFSPSDLDRSALALAGFAPGVWAYSLNHVLTRAFYAQGDTRTPMRIAIAMVAVNFVLNLLLIWPLREAGLAVATSLSATIQCLVLFAAVRRTPAVAGPLLDPEVGRSFARVALASVAMAACVLAIQRLAPLPGTWPGHFVALLIGSATGVAAYAAASRALRIPELGWLLRR
jgi:putative peptidoglycan lipid II flippase